MAKLEKHVNGGLSRNGVKIYSKRGRWSRNREVPLGMMWRWTSGETRANVSRRDGFATGLESIDQDPDLDGVP